MFEYTTQVVLDKMVESFILYQLLETSFGKLLRCSGGEIISIFSGYDDKNSHALGTLEISKRRTIFQRIDIYNRPISGTIIFNSMYEFVNDKDIQEYISEKSIGELKFSEISDQMIKKVREFVVLLSPIVCDATVVRLADTHIPTPRITVVLKHHERIKKIQLDNSPFDIKQRKSDAKFMRALILYTYMSSIEFDDLRSTISCFICEMSKTKKFPEGYIDNVVRFAELFYQGKFIINTCIVKNRYFRKIKSANDPKPVEAIQCDLIHEKIKDNE